MNKEQPLFTVAVITYNSANWVKYTIESILAATFRDFELVISDDCSTDNTWDIITSYSDERIRAWRNPENLREYPNRNKVLQAARGKYIIYIDGDDILYKDSLERLSKYVMAFPDAGSIWGVADFQYNFMVFPYLLQPQEIVELIYCYQYRPTIVGFAETLFKTASLQKIGGFSEVYAIGDTYIKKKIACHFPVLMVPRGFTFWRQTVNQASNVVRKNNRSLVEDCRMDQELVSAPFFPLLAAKKEKVVLNINILYPRLIVKNTLLKGKLIRFFSLLKQTNLSVLDCRYIFRKMDLSYTIGATSEKPLDNEYNYQ